MKKVLPALMMIGALVTVVSVRSNAQVAISVHIGTPVRVVRTAPPPPPPPPPVHYHRPPRPSRFHVWIEGDWVMRGGVYVQTTGYWARPPHRGMVYVGGYWSYPPHHHAKVWVPGHWE